MGEDGQSPGAPTVTEQQPPTANKRFLSTTPREGKLLISVFYKLHQGWENYGLGAAYGLLRYPKSCQLHSFIFYYKGAPEQKRYATILDVQMLEYQVSQQIYCWSTNCAIGQLSVDQVLQQTYYWSTSNVQASCHRRKLNLQMSCRGTHGTGHFVNKENK